MCIRDSRRFLGYPRELLVYALLRLRLPSSYRVYLLGYTGGGPKHVPDIGVYLPNSPEPIALLEITGTTYSLSELRLRTIFVLRDKLEYAALHPRPESCYIVHITDGDLPAAKAFRWIDGTVARNYLDCCSWTGKTRQGVRESFAKVPLKAWKPWPQLIKTILLRSPLPPESIREVYRVVESKR